MYGGFVSQWGSMQIFFTLILSNHNIKKTHKQALLWVFDLYFQFNVIASDQRASPRTATARVHLTILRDNFAPQFTFDPYNTDVTENTVDGTNFITVTATDQDLRVSWYDMGILKIETRKRILVFPLCFLKKILNFD